MNTSIKFGLYAIGLSVIYLILFVLLSLIPLQTIFGFVPYANPVQYALIILGLGIIVYLIIIFCLGYIVGRLYEKFYTKKK